MPAENQDDFLKIPEIQTRRFVITSRRFVSCPFDTVSVRLNSAFLDDAIALAEHDDAGLPVLDLMFGDVGKLMMVRTSPLFPWKAAAPLRTIWPEPGSPGMA